MTKAENAALKQFPIPYEISEEDKNSLVNTGRRRIYANGYRKAEKDTIERAVEWLEERDLEFYYLHSDSDGYPGIDTDNLIADFKKAMEEETK